MGNFSPTLTQGAFVLVGKGRCKIEQLIDTFHTNDAGLLEDGVINASVPARAPVWDAAAFAPAPVRPDFITRTGLGIRPM